MTASAASSHEAGDRNGPWIAYSTASSADPSYHPDYGTWGSDVFITLVGGRPKLVAGRGTHNPDAWNTRHARSSIVGRLL